MFYKEDCLHGIVHIQSRTAPMEGLRFFLLVQIMDTAKKRKGHGKITSLQAMSVHQLSSLHLLFQYLKLQKDELNVWTSQPAYRYVQLGDY